MRSGFNPTRRNKNIGTAKQGHGRDNKLEIPAICNAERIWWEQLASFQIGTHSVAGREVRFIIEELNPGYVHVCTTDDVCHLLELIPVRDWEGINTFLFRQPTQKQRILKPVWGRLAYSADVGQPGKPNIHSGPLIILEAQTVPGTLKWSHSLPPEDMRELDRLRADGHNIVDDGRHHVIGSNLQAVRATQLYRTLPHELGHWLDHLEKVERPSEKGLGDYSELSDLYFARPQSEREAFAHRYADECRARLLKSGVIPFERIESDHR